jgi:hypothetical protein
MTDDDGMTWGYRPPTAKGFEVPTPNDTPNPHSPRTSDTPPPPSEPAHATSPSPIATPATHRSARPPVERPMPMTRPRRARSSSNWTETGSPSTRILRSKALWFFPVAVISLMAIAARTQSRDEPTFPTFDVTDLTFGSLPRAELPEPTAASTSNLPTTPTNNTNLAMGEYRDVGSFAITVVDFVPDATTMVAGASLLNEPAPAAHRYVMVSIEAENQALVEATWWVEMLVEVRDGTGATYPSFQGPIAPSPLPFEPIVPGAVVVGNLVFTVPGDVSDLEFVVHPDFGRDEIVWQLAS